MPTGRRSSAGRVSDQPDNHPRDREYEAQHGQRPTESVLAAVAAGHRSRHAFSPSPPEAVPCLHQRVRGDKHHQATSNHHGPGHVVHARSLHRRGADRCPFGPPALSGQRSRVGRSRGSGGDARAAVGAPADGRLLRRTRRSSAPTQAVAWQAPSRLFSQWKSATTVVWARRLPREGHCRGAPQFTYARRKSRVLRTTHHSP